MAQRHLAETSVRKQQQLVQICCMLDCTLNARAAHFARPDASVTPLSYKVLLLHTQRRLPINSRACTRSRNNAEPKQLRGAVASVAVAALTNSSKSEPKGAGARPWHSMAAD